MDELYGTPRKPAGKGVKKYERDTDGNVLDNPTTCLVSQFKPREGVTKYIWLVLTNGDIVVGEEYELSQRILLNGELIDLKLGHPTLCQGKRARIGGELELDDRRKTGVLNNHSGRYSKDQGRKERNLQNAYIVFCDALPQIHLSKKWNPYYS